MQKVHGPALEHPIRARHGYLEQRAATALVVGLALLFILCALIFFGFVGTSS